MIAGIIFLAGLLVVVFGIAADRRRVFWRDARRPSAPPVFLVVNLGKEFRPSTTVLPAAFTVIPA